MPALLHLAQLPTLPLASRGCPSCRDVALRLLRLGENGLQSGITLPVVALRGVLR